MWSLPKKNIEKLNIMTFIDSLIINNIAVPCQFKKGAKTTERKGGSCSGVGRPARGKGTPTYKLYMYLQAI